MSLDHQCLTQSAVLGLLELECPAAFLRLTHTGLRSHFDSRSIPVLLRTLTLIESVQAATQEIDAPLDLPALVELLLHYVTPDGQPGTDQGV